jgi:hypothetical protein
MVYCTHAPSSRTYYVLKFFYGHVSTASVYSYTERLTNPKFITSSSLVSGSPGYLIFIELRISRIEEPNRGNNRQRLGQES